MTDVDNLADRLQAYGGQLQGELAGWPSFVPVEPTGLGVPLLLLRRRLGRWLGAGRRPSLAWLAGAVLVIVVGVGAFMALRGDRSDDPVAVESAPGAIASEPTTANQANAAADTDEADGDPDAADGVSAGAAEDRIESDAATDVSAHATAPESTTTEFEPVAADPGGETEPSGASGDGSALSVRCPVGEPSGGLCKIVSAPITLPGELECLTSRGLVEDETGCFRFDEATAACPVGTSLEGPSCTRIVGAPTRDVPTCDPGSALEGDRCIREVAGTWGCATGQFRDEQCVVQGPAPDGGDLVCSVGDRDRTGEECVAYSEVSCGELVAVAGGCRQPGSVQKVEHCPADSILTGSRCEPTDGCKHSYSKTIGPCGSAPTTELVCSLTGVQVAADGQCSTIVSGTCVTGTLRAGRCAEQRPLSVNAARCAAEWTLVGLTCVRYDEPMLQCPDSAASVADSCVVASPAQVNAAVCPGPSELVNGSCVRTEPAELSCAQGTLVGNDCRTQVEASERVGCHEGAVRVLDECVRYERPAGT